MKRTAPRLWGRLLVTAAVAATVLAVPLTGTGAATVTVAIGSAHGQGIQVDTSLIPDPDDLLTTFPTRGDVSRSEAAMDTGGFGAGELVARGFAVVVEGDTPGVENAQFALADTHAPSDENDCDPAAPSPACDDGTLAEADALGLLAATVLGSRSTASTAHSLNHAEAASAQVIASGTLPEVVASTVEGVAAVEQVAPDPSPVTDADAAASLADVRVGDEASPILTAEVIQSTATATATGGAGSAAGTTCEILNLTVLGNSLGDVACADVAPVEVACASVLGVETPGVRVAFGVEGPDPAVVSPDLAAAGVTAVVVEVTESDGAGGCVAAHSILLSQSSARSERVVEDRPDETVCDRPLDAQPTASGAALGEVLRANDPNDPAGSGLLELSAARSEAEFDEAGLPEAPDVEPPGQHGARAWADPLLLRALNAPGHGPPSFSDSSTVVEVVDAHADAPTSEDESHTLVSLSAGLPPPTGIHQLSAEVVSSSAQAATSPDAAENLDDGSASATTSIDKVDVATNPLTLGLPVFVDLDQVQSSASSHDTGTSTFSTAGENLTMLDATVDGVNIEAELIVTKDDDLGGAGTTAVATGVPGGADADTNFTIARLVVAGTDLATLVPNPLTNDSDNDGNPDPATIHIVDGGLPVATVFIGHVTTDVDPAGTFAHITVDPVVVQIPGDSSASEPDPGAVLVRLGRTEAHAVFPAPDTTASMVVTKSVDIHFDAMSFDDDGELIAPHQKFWYGFCVGNDGAVTLTNVALEDALDDLLRIVQESNEPDGGEDGIFTALADWTIVSGNDIQTKDPFTLAPGEERRFKILVEVPENAALGTVFTNTAVGSADQLAGTVSSNTTTNTVGFADDRPATLIQILDRSAEPHPDDPDRRILTLTVRLVNQGNGTAFDARVDLITLSNPDWDLLTPLPILLGDVPAMSSTDPFDIEFEIPEETTTSQLIFRERAEDSGGNPFAFDTTQEAEAEAEAGASTGTRPDKGKNRNNN